MRACIVIDNLHINAVRLCGTHVHVHVHCIDMCQDGEFTNKKEAEEFLGRCTTMQCGSFGPRHYLQASFADLGGVIADALKISVHQFSRGDLQADVVYDASNQFYMTDKDQCERAAEALRDAHNSLADGAFQYCHLTTPTTTTTTQTTTPTTTYSTTPTATASCADGTYKQHVPMSTHNDHHKCRPWTVCLPGTRVLVSTSMVRKSV